MTKKLSTNQKEILDQIQQGISVKLIAENKGVLKVVSKGG